MTTFEQFFNDNPEQKSIYEKEYNESVMPMANPADGGLPGGLLPEEGTEEHCSPKGED